MKICNHKSSTIKNECDDLLVKEALFPEVEMKDIKSNSVDDEPFLINDEPLQDNNLDDCLTKEDCNQKINSERDITDTLNRLINSEQDAIQEYQGVLAFITSPEDTFMYKVPGIVPILKDILAEESTHLGQLQHLLEISTDVGKNLIKGKKEAIEQIEEVQSEGDALHPVFNQVPVKEFSSELNIQPEFKIIDGIKKLPVQSMHYVDSNMNANTESSCECSGEDFCTVTNIDDEF